MDQAKKIYAQVKDLFLSMTPGNRVIAVLLLATLLVSLGYLVVGSVKTGESKSNYVDLLDGYEFDNREKQKAEMELRTAKFDEHRWVGNVLRVPAKKASIYTATISGALTDRGLERQNTAKAMSAWQSAKMMDTQMVASKEIDIANAIKALGGIAEASVISNRRIDWHRNVWAREQKYSAAVTVKPTHNRPLDDGTISAIGNIVARAFGITDLKEISIVDSENNRAYYGSGEEVSASGGGDYLKHQVRYQEDLNRRIYEFLPPISGLKVQTSVELTKMINESIFDVTHGKPTVLADHVKGSDYERVGYDRFGRPGQVAELGRPLIDPPVGVDNRARTKEIRHEREFTNALQGQEQRAEIVPFTPIRILASLQIPREYVRKIWLEENTLPNTEPTEPTPEELADRETQMTREIKESVSQLLMLWWDKKTTPDPLDMVQVKYYQPIREKEVELTSWQQVRIWLGQNWQSLALMGLVLCGLCVLWAITKPAKPEPIVIYEAPEIPMEVIEARAQVKAEEEAAARAAAEEDDEEALRSLDGFDRSIRSLQDEIAELVEENPEAAAAVLRQWIGNAVLVEKTS